MFVKRPLPIHWKSVTLNVTGCHNLHLELEIAVSAHPQYVHSQISPEA